MTYILLIIFFNSSLRTSTMTSIPSFRSMDECLAAGKKAADIQVKYGEMKTVCLEQRK